MGLAHQGGDLWPAASLRPPVPLTWFGPRPSLGLIHCGGGCGSWSLLNPPDTGAQPATWWRERSARTPRGRSGRSLRAGEGEAAQVRPAPGSWAWQLPRGHPHPPNPAGGSRGWSLPRSPRLRYLRPGCPVRPPHRIHPPAEVPPAPAPGPPWPYLVKTQEAMPLTSSRRMQLYRTCGLSSGSETTCTSPRLVSTARWCSP